MKYSKKIYYWNRYISTLKKYGPRNLSACYGSPSSIKKNIWDEATHLFCKEHGHWLHILTYNQFIFTYGFICRDPNTGDTMFRVETPTSSGYLPLDADMERQLKEIM